MANPLIDTTALDTAISSAAAQAGALHDSTADIAKIQTAATAMENNLTWGMSSQQTVKTLNGPRNATFISGTPWPQLSS